MFSDTRQLGLRTLFHHNNEPVVPTEAAHMGPGRQTAADAPQLDGRKETGLAMQEEFRLVQGKDRTGARSEMGQNFERKLICTRPWFAVQPATAGQSSLGESSFPRWNQCPEAGQRCSLPVNTCLRTCGCTGPRHQTASHPFLRKCMLPSPALPRDQDHYREPGYVPEKQFWGYPKEKYQRETYDSGSEHSMKSYNRYHGLNSNFYHSHEDYHVLKDLTRPKIHPEKVCNGPKFCQRVSSSSKASLSPWNCTSQQSQCLSGNNPMCVLNKLARESLSPRKELQLKERKRRQQSVRDQIRQVVMDLEDVLDGLKKVHLEMKEVVQQIELLTSNIDLSEEEITNDFPSNTICSSSSSGVVVSCQKRVINQELKVDPGSSNLQNTTVQPKPPVLNPSIIVTNQAVLLAPCKASPKHMSGMPFVERLQPTSSPRNQIPKTQNAGDGLGPVLSRTGLQAQNHTVVCKPGGPETVNPRALPYSRSGQAGTNGKVEDSVRTPQCAGKRRLLSTTV